MQDVRDLDWMKGLKRLIINADDFGRHELINQAVEKGVTEGCLRSATLMPGGKAFESAVAVARRHEKLGVGIHFTLVNGYPILPPREIPSLVTAEGVFFDDYTVFRIERSEEIGARKDAKENVDELGEPARDNFGPEETAYPDPQ